jgi:hypothetical protein
LDGVLSEDGTNSFSIPMNDMDRAMAQNSIASLFSGFAFNWSGKLFPKYSWPWTAAREAAFVLANQGRYTSAELDRLFESDDTGPIGSLVIAHLLALANSPEGAKNAATRGLTRLSAEDFLRDCGLFLEGKSGLAVSFAEMVKALRALPENELKALLAVMPEGETTLIREAASALREKPDSPQAVVLRPVLSKYWNTTLRAKVREALREFTALP